jgi:hypothetical protein
VSSDVTAVYSTTSVLLDVMLRGCASDSRLFEGLWCLLSSGVPRNFVRGGGGSTNSVEDRGQREGGSGGGSPLVRGSAQFAIQFLLGCYGCIFHGPGNSGQLCQNFGISGGGGCLNTPPHPKDAPASLSIRTARMNYIITMGSETILVVVQSFRDVRSWTFIVRYCDRFQLPGRSLSTMSECN